jgi:C4-type Zn-finger protein
MPSTLKLSNIFFSECWDCAYKSCDVMLKEEADNISRVKVALGSSDD